MTKPPRPKSPLSKAKRRTDDPAPGRTAAGTAAPPPAPLPADLLGEFLEAWRTNHRITLFVLDRVDDAGLRCTLSKRGGRSVARQFAHLHYVRIYHLKNRAPRLTTGAHLFATGEEPGRGELRSALEDSSRRIEEYFRGVATGTSGFRTARKGITTNLAYLVAHESHHRGNILLTLKECGRPLDSDTRYAIWDWDRR